MADITIRLAQAEDAEGVAGMLACLADELGDGAVFATTPEIVRRFGFGPEPAFSCLVAETEAELSGLALFFRHFSTTRGLPGVYVQDLWVAPAVRGRGVGVDLLAAVVRDAERAWQAGYLKLSVYRHNIAASRFYQRLGFAAHENDVPMTIASRAFHELAQRKGSAT